ncbi:MAG: hypothetical protein LBS17_00325, partial [Actinomycetes bacterium]|nr:hypothetical protein [Actinomycetes bacterium]
LNARSYDPVTAVFTAQDTYRGETGDPSTLNYYAYCGGDPINATDPSGHDAVWLQDINGVYGFGHTGALFYGGGAWQHFYYGSSATTKVGGKKKKQIIGIKKLKSSFHWRASYIFDPATRELIKTTSALSNLNKAVHSTKNRKSGEVIYKGNYDGHVYFKGNFTRSIAAAKKKYTKKSVKKYDLLAHNCMHATIDMLLKGTFSFKKKASTARKKMRKVLRDTRNNNHVPNYAYTRVSLEYARLKKKYGTK